jgi:hypothetical protein
VQASEEKANRYRDGSAKGTQIWLTTAVMKHGQAAPASSSSPGMGVDAIMGTHQVQWATPQSRDAKGAEGRMIREGQHTDLPSQLEVAPTGQWNRANGKLNPRWVETLMGLPIGWTMPSCIRPVTTAPTSCDYSATALCRPSQSEPSDFLLASCGNWTTPNQVDATIEKGALRPSRIATGRKTDYLARQVQMQLK